MDIVLECVILAMMFILGAVFGSFACCQAWRWHYKVHSKKILDNGQSVYTVINVLNGMIIFRSYHGWF